MQGPSILIKHDHENVPEKFKKPKWQDVMCNQNSSSKEKEWLDVVASLVLAMTPAFW